MQRVRDLGPRGVLGDEARRPGLERLAHPFGRDGREPDLEPPLLRPGVGREARGLAREERFLVDRAVHPQVLAVLDRTHSPGRAPAAALEARAAGFDHVNIDQIVIRPRDQASAMRFNRRV